PQRRAFDLKLLDRYERAAFGGSHASPADSRSWCPPVRKATGRRRGGVRRRGVPTKNLTPGLPLREQPGYRNSTPADANKSDANSTLSRSDPTPSSMSRNL